MLSDALERPFTSYDFFQQLKALPFVEAIYVYGSHGIGIPHARSDIDLAISAPHATDAQWQEAAAIAENADILVNVDVTWLENLEPGPQKDCIMQFKRLLYLKNNYLHFIDNKKKNLQTSLDSMDAQLNAFSQSLHGTAISSDAFHALCNNFHAMYEMLWKAVFKHCLRLYGIHSYSPRSIITHAFMEGWIEDRYLWEIMLADLAVMNEPSAMLDKRAIFDRFPLYAATMRDACSRVQRALHALPDAQPDISFTHPASEKDHAKTH